MWCTASRVECSVRWLLQFLLPLTDVSQDWLTSPRFLTPQLCQSTENSSAGVPWHEWSRLRPPARTCSPRGCQSFPLFPRCWHHHYMLQAAWHAASLFLHAWTLSINWHVMDWTEMIGFPVIWKNTAMSSLHYLKIICALFPFKRVHQAKTNTFQCSSPAINQFWLMTECKMNDIAISISCTCVLFFVLISKCLHVAMANIITKAKHHDMLTLWLWAC